MDFVNDIVEAIIEENKGTIDELIKQKEVELKSLYGLDKIANDIAEKIMSLQFAPRASTLCSALHAAQLRWQLRKQMPGRIQTQTKPQRKVVQFVRTLPSLDKVAKWHPRIL